MWLLRCLSTLALLAICVLFAGSRPAALRADEPAADAPLSWNTDYSDAVELAKSEKKMMFIYFYDPANAAGNDFEAKTLDNPAIREKLASYVIAKVPTNAEITMKGVTSKLLDHPAFDDMKHGPGLAVIDFANEGTELQYGYVVSMLPFQRGKYYQFRADYVPVLLDLPPGTLTQRTMIWAVRIHPEAPASTLGQESPVLVDEANKSATYQAQIRVQGHHNWDNRFQRIIGRLLGIGQTRYTPVEVVAESWPGEDLVDSCVDCVASWRQSEGHWNAVKAKHVSYGYDIRKGSNGIWYAAGIFAN